LRPLPAFLFKSPFLFFGSLLAFLAGCGWFSQKPSLVTREGDPLEIRLPANFSTGYRWVLEPTLQAGRIISDNYTANPSSPGVGAPGIQMFRVVFPREGQFNLKFAYRRLWEPSTTPPAQTTNLVIRVLPSKSDRPLLEKLFRGNDTPDSNNPQPESEEEQATGRRVELRRPQ